MTKAILAAIAIIAMMNTLPAFAENVDPEVEKQRSMAIALMGKGKHLDASKIMEALVERSPLSERDHYLYGETLYNLGRYNEAAMEFKQARNIKPEEGLYSARCAEAYMAAGKKEEASAMCQLAMPQCKDPAALKMLQSIQKLANFKGILQPPPPDKGEGRTSPVSSGASRR